MAERRQYAWSKDGWEWVGRPSNEMEPATKKQSRGTCWAASMAIVNAVLAGGIYDDEDEWSQYVLRNSGTVGQHGGIKPIWFIDMAQTLSEDGQMPLSCEVYGAAEMPMEKISGALRSGALVLLHSKEHVVVLSALAIDHNGTLKYRVTDPAPGAYQSWDQRDLDAYKHEHVSIVRRKPM
jgi:hypothetical protein